MVPYVIVAPVNGRLVVIHTGHRRSCERAVQRYGIGTVYPLATSPVTVTRARRG